MRKPPLLHVAAIFLSIIASSNPGNAQAATADTPAEYPQTENADNEILQNAKKFSVNGVRLGMSREDFLKKYPNAHLQMDKRAEYGEVGYQIISDSGSKVNGYYFLDGSLFILDIIYSAEGMSRAGGVDAYVDHIVSKLGKADADSPGTHPADSKYSALLWWDFASSIGRYFELNVMADNTVIFKIFDKKKDDILSKRKLEKSNVGF